MPSQIDFGLYSDGLRLVALIWEPAALRFGRRSSSLKKEVLLVQNLSLPGEQRAIWRAAAEGTVRLAGPCGARPTAPTTHRTVIQESFVEGPDKHTNKWSNHHSQTAGAIMITIPRIILADGWPQEGGGHGGVFGSTVICLQNTRVGLQS